MTKETTDNHGIDKKRRLAGNTIIVFVSQIIPFIVDSCIIKIYSNTSYLPREEFGTFDYWNSLIEFAIPVASLGIGFAVFRRIIDLEGMECNRTIFYGLLVEFFTTITVMAGLFVFFRRQIPTSLLAGLVIWYASAQLLMYYRYVARGLGLFKQYGFSLVLASVVNITSTLVFVRYMGMGLSGVILSVTIAYSCSFLYLTVSVRLKGPLFQWRMINTEELRSLLWFAIGTVPNSISYWLLKISDRWIIAAVLGLALTADYAVINKVPAIFTAVITMFSTVWKESAARSRDRKYWGETYRAYVNILMGLTILSIGYTPLYYRLFISSDYKSTLYQVPLLLAACFFFGINSFLDGILYADYKVKIAGAASGVAAAINVIVNLLFMRAGGIAVAVISTFAAYAIVAVFKLFYLQKGGIRLMFFDAKVLVFILYLLLHSLLYGPDSFVISAIISTVCGGIVCFSELFAMRSLIKKK